jgi:MATE family multidrug resistance protein
MSTKLSEAPDEHEVTGGASLTTNIDVDMGSDRIALRPASLFREALSDVVSAVPIALVDISKLLVPALTTMHVGHSADATALAGAALGTLTFNIAGCMIVTAPLNAMDTIAQQAFGAGRKEGVGLALQRALIVAVLFMVPTLPLWIWAEPILEALGQPTEVASYGAYYMQLLMPSLAPLVVFEAMRKYVYAQNIRMPPLPAALIGLASHPLWLQLWCNTGLGVTGAPIAIASAYMVMCTALFVHLRWFAPSTLGAWPRGYQQRLLWRDRAAWRHFLCTSAAALVSLSEWLYWEVVCFRVGAFGTLPLAAYGIAYSLEPVFFMVPLGLSTGLANSIGNRLGAGQVAGAKRLTLAAFLIVGGIIVTYVLIAYAARRALTGLFSTDEMVLAAAAELWPAFCIFMLASGIFALLLGLNRGLGLQGWNAKCVMAIMWPLGAPLVIFAAHTPTEVWYMLTVMYGLLLLGLAAGAACSSWEHLSRIAIAAASSGESCDADGAPTEMTTMPPASGGLAAMDSCTERAADRVER